MAVATPTLTPRTSARRGPPGRTRATARPQRRALDLEAVTTQWQRALDAADRALDSAAFVVRNGDLRDKRAALARERRTTEEAIARVAQVAGVNPAPWLSPVPVTPSALGLDSSVRACLFDLDGVLTNSHALHAHAWADVFDDFLLRLSEKTGWHRIPFDPDVDYRLYVDGQSRIEGVHRFLASRGIRVPEGRPGDPPDAATAWGLAARKGETLASGLRHPGVAALAGSRRYLEAAGRAGLPRAVVSASTTALPMLVLADLATLVEERIDADVMRTEGLRSRPAPDLLLAACNRLGVAPSDAVTFTHSAAGIAAGNSAGLAVVGVATGTRAEELAGFGAERVVPNLAGLLDAHLADRDAIA
jgi:HAD superfamily hydrolase (TIGR01509 family)